MSTIPISGVSACIPCRERKRGCDKDIPACSNCTKAGRICFYEYQNGFSHALPHVEERYYSQPENTPSVRFPTANPMLHLQHSLLDSITLSRDSLHCFLVDQVYRFVGDTNAQLETARQFFRTVHSWIQFVHMPSFMGQLHLNQTRPNIDSCFLILCMKLVTTECSKDRVSPDLSPLYVMTKSIIPAMEIHGNITLQNIQGRILITLYEIGHLIQPAFFLSVSSVARCAIALGCNTKVKPGCGTAMSWFKLEEERRVWWTIYILDSYLPILTGFYNFITDDPSLDDLLPVEDGLWNTSSPHTPQSLPLMTPESVRVGPLARTVQAAHILRRTTIHVRGAPPDPTFNTNEAIHLFRVMTTLSELLSRQATDPYCMNFCGAISMCNSARILLFQHHQLRDPTGHRERCDQYFGSTIDSCATINHMAERFNSIAAMFDLNSLNLLLPYSIYQAALIQATGFFQDPESDKTRIEELLKMLSIFSKRWRIAKIHLERLTDITNE